MHIELLQQRGITLIEHLWLADLAADRFQTNRVHVGKIIEHGAAPYENDAKNTNSYFVKLETERGERTVWGVDLKRALEQGKAGVGDHIALAYQGRQQVQVKLNDKTTGQVALQPVNRNTWDVNRLDSVREEVAQRLAEAARATDNRQPILKVYDRNAPREQARPEVNREASRRAERTRG